MTGTHTSDRLPEQRWPATIAILAAVLIYLLLPAHGALLPRWIIPVILGGMLVPMLVLQGIALQLFSGNHLDVISRRLAAGDPDVQHLPFLPKRR